MLEIYPYPAPSAIPSVTSHSRLQPAAGTAQTSDNLHHQGFFGHTHTQKNDEQRENEPKRPNPPGPPAAGMLRGGAAIRRNITDIPEDVGFEADNSPQLLQRRARAYEHMMRH